jgi:chromosome segregation ATPase
MELKQTKRKLSDVTEKLECAKQLSETDAMPDAQELAGRLVVSEQAQKVLKAENDEKLKERDAAIANLLCSLQANEGVISNLRMDVDNFKSKMNECAEESRRLQHENEIFASQIIDQDEEFETLNNRLREKTAEIASLKRDIANNSADVRNVKNFERQLDELREEKRYNVSRINKLEVELRDVDMRKAEDNGYELERVKLELRNAIDDRAATEERLNKQIESLRKLRNHAVEDFETKLHQRDSQIASLEKELLDLREKASSAEDDFDDIFLDADGKGQQESNKQLLEERDMLLAKIETLGEEIETLRATKDIDQVSELQSKLEQSERVREELEHDRSLFNSSKEREMDRLHRQLSEAREAQTAREMEQLSLLKKLESENDALRDEFCLQMKEKQAKIVALEQTLSAQEQVVGNMSNEMDQLQNGMEKVSIQRRAEIEEMTQELMDYTSKATRLERQVTALSMKLDEKKLKHKTEVAKLKDRIATLESESPLERIVRKDHTSNKHDDNRRREHELSEKNDHLKWLNNSLSDENKRLKERMESLKAKSAKKDGESPSPLKQSAKNNDKWRNVALQEQVAVLSQRVIELEENAAASSVAAAQSRRPPQSPRPSILHSPVIRSSLDKGSSARSSSAPKSALRVSTYDDSNQANDLLSNSDDEEARNTNSRKNAGASTPPPSIPRPGEEGGGSNSTKHHSSEKSKGGSKSSSRFSLRKKSAPKFDDASNSTTNYDF